MASQWIPDSTLRDRRHAPCVQPNYSVVESQKFLLITKYFYKVIIVVVMHSLVEFG
jgi:hypothetical protein